MEKIKNIFLKSEKPIIYFPPDEIESWKRLKQKYFSLGYKWLDFTLEYNERKIKRYDRKNIKEYEKRKNHEKKMRNSFRGPGNIPIVYPPPSPTNMERYQMLLRWSKNDNYNISMITYYLFTNHGLKPCQEYQPDNIINTYNNYSQRHLATIPCQEPETLIDRRPSYENSIGRNTSVIGKFPPPLPPPPKKIELRNTYLEGSSLVNSGPSAPPSYNQLLDQLA